MAAKGSTVVLDVSGVHWAASKSVAEAVLSRRPGVIDVAANPVPQTATVTYDPSRTSLAELAGWVRDCGYHCAGQSVPDHICDPLAEPAAAPDKHDHPQTTSQAHASTARRTTMATPSTPGARPWRHRARPGARPWRHRARRRA